MQNAVERISDYVFSAFERFSRLSQVTNQPNNQPEVTLSYNN